MNKKTLWVLSGVVLSISLLNNSCTYHNKELQYPDNPVNCDTSAVTYSGSIVPLFSQFCYSCHSGTASNGNGIQLDQYATARAYALFGGMLQAVKQDAGFVAMPKDAGKLSDCNIAKIRIWIQAGAPNN